MNAYYCDPMLDPHCPYQLTLFKEMIANGELQPYKPPEIQMIPLPPTVSLTFTPEGYVIEGYPI